MLIEAMSLGMFLPLFEIMFNEQLNDKFKIFFSKINFLEIKIEYFIVIIFIIFFLLKNIFLVISTFLQTRVLEKTRYELKSKLFEKYMKQDYSFFLNSNTSYLLRNNTHDCDNAIYIFYQSLIFTSELLVTLGTLAILLYFDFVLTSSIFFPSLIFLSIIFLNLKKKLSNYGNTRVKNEGDLIKFLSQGFFASKEVKLLHAETSLLDNTKFALQNLLKINIITNFLKQIVKNYLEIFIVILFSVVLMTMFYFDFEKNLINIKLSFLFIAAVRLFPAMTRMFVAFQEIRYRKSSLINLEKEFKKFQLNIDQTKKNYNKENVKFNKSIEIKDLNFSYENSKNLILEKINLKINKGEKIGIIGYSGSGKTTLINIISGLSIPSSEKLNIKVDGYEIYKNLSSWQKKIGYVPQDTYLIDDNIINNVAFGLSKEKIDLPKVIAVLKKSEILTYFESLPQKLKTLVGEDGINLSGGQKQRLGLARALYNDPDLLLLDEATSALDYNTEEKIMKTITNLKDKTVIAVTHRQSTLKYLDKVYELINGKLTLKK